MFLETYQKEVSLYGSFDHHCCSGRAKSLKKTTQVYRIPLRNAEECYRAWNEGASLAHIHARNDDGSSTQDPDVYARIIDGQSENRYDCSGICWRAVGMTVTERVTLYHLNQIWHTYMWTCNFGDGIFTNSQADIEFFAKAMKENGVKPEFEIFEVGMIETAKRLAKKRLVDLPGHFDFVMGVPGAITGDPRSLAHLISMLPSGSTWTAAGIGRHELPLGAMAIILGGHVRVGFEDNIYYSRGVPAKSNGELVARMARLAKELGRPVAKPSEARKILGIDKC